MSRDRPSAIVSPPFRIACIGGAAVDRKYRAPARIISGTSNPAAARQSFGGVARNVAESLARLGAPTALFSAVGDDENGRALITHLRGLSVDLDGMLISRRHPTAEYVAIIEPDSSLHVGVANMKIFDDLDAAWLDAAWPRLSRAEWIFADCNLPPPTLALLFARCAESPCKLAVDAVSTAKAQRLPESLRGVDLLFLNHDEALARIPDAGDIASAALALHRQGAAAAIVTSGAKGLAVASNGETMIVPAAAAQSIDVTGAGDAVIAGALSRLLAGDRLPDALRYGAKLAALTTECEASARPDLSPDLILS